MEFLLDTNFLVVPIRFHIDVFHEIRKHYPKAEFAVTDGAMRELLKLHEKKVASRLLEKNGARVVQTRGGDVDSAMLAYAAANAAVICTNDADLRSRCRSKGVRTVFVKKRKTLGASWDW
ncbi:hypothetical protein HYS54_04400 [Candidatus Micrarchaeota archaeon]|nr:hypothetical protein [Candidatus Micrarchaeota archaeon]